MLIIYTDNITPRVKYTFDYVFNELLGVDYKPESDLEKYNHYSGPKISYGPNEISSNHLLSHSLLFEDDLKKTDVQVATNKNLTVLFPTNKESLLSHDIFSAVFFMISRYEEYLPFNADKHGRFTSDQSIAGKNKFLRKPVVNLWAEQFKEKLQEIYPILNFRNRKFEFINTIDIDNAYAYKGKSLWRKVGSLLRAVLVLDFVQISERFGVWFANRKDPYDTYDLIIRTHQKNNLNSIIFFLLGNYSSVDKNISHRSKVMHLLVNRISAKMKIGIHPSYLSNTNNGMVQIEKKRLEEISGKSVDVSRQHFLKLRFPGTYENLLESGIKFDYSMSYADDWGFRAGTCIPFYFFNLKSNAETDLLLYPNTIMEATFKYYLKLSPDKAFEEIKIAIDTVYKAGGTFVSLWHNESLSENKIWVGWSKVYSEMVDYIIGMR